MDKCKMFCNANCSFNCPNAAIERWEERFDLDAEKELGIERTSCKECMYSYENCTCENDCYFYKSKECPNV